LRRATIIIDDLAWRRSAPQFDRRSTCNAV